MQFAHASGLIDPWGAAYAGSVIGAVLVGLWIVRDEITRRAAPDSRGSGDRGVSRWMILIGFVCGGSFGLGTARILERVLDAPPDPAAVAQRLCDAKLLDDPAPILSDLHDELDHAARDLAESTELVGAHRELDELVDQRADSVAVRAAISVVVTELERVAPDAGISGCGT